MHELHADSLAVSIFVGLDELTQLPLWLSLQDCAALSVLKTELALHVSLGESVGGRVKHLDKFFIGETELFGEARAILVVFLKMQGINI